MSSLADKNLSKSAQDKISNITAQAQSGKISWSEANKQANAVRASEGANYTVSSGGTTSYNDGSSISSYKSGSKVSGGGSAQRDYDNYEGSSSGVSSGSTAKSGGSTTDLVKGPGYVTGGYTTGGVYGTPTLESNPYWKNGASASGADMSRRPDLAGKYAISNGYTVYYDDDGYATKAKKGVVDYTPYQDINAGNGTYNSSGAWTDNEVLTAADRQKIADIRAQMQAGLISGDRANQLANEIRSGYGYTIDKAGNVTDLGAMSAVDARRQAWGLPINGVSAEMQNYLQLMAPEQQTTDPYALLASQYTLGNSKSGGNSNVGYGDAYQYIQDMYDANIASQLAALKSAYEQNVLDYNAQDDLISKQAQQLRNQAASQNDLQRMYMNEMGIMQGLNTGATGQMALAQSAALQGSFADIGTQEQQALADSALERSKLKVQYSAAVDQAIAQNNYELANALLDAYYREVDAAQQAAAAEQEQANWQAKFDYQKQQDAWTNAAVQAELLAGFGDFSGYKALGYSDAQIAMMQNAWNAQYGTPAVGTTGTTSKSPKKKNTGGYNNGSLTTEQVKVLQNYYGVTADGLWGKNSSNAAGGMTAAQAWEAYLSGPLKSIEQSVGMNRTSNGQATAIQNALTSGRITEAQAEAMLRKFGIM